MGANPSLMDELEQAVQTGSREKRVDTLRRVTDLFLVAPARLNDEQVQVFDEVLTHLIARVEDRARAELARRLAPIEQAPGEVIRKLAHDDAIEVAGPVLTQSKRLTTEDLVGIAEQKSQAHLLAIAGRVEIAEQVTDVLIGRGNRDVMHRLASNSGAAFSEDGYSTMVERADGDESLMEKLGRRTDISLGLLRELLPRATEAVRARLLASVSSDRQDEIRTVLTEISGEIVRESTPGPNVDDAKRLVQMMQETDRLNESELGKFARQRKYEESVAALAAMCAVPYELIDRLMDSLRCDALLVPCKAAGIGWPTVRALLDVRGARHSASEHDVEAAAIEFKKLTPQTAARVLRFWQVRQTVGAQTASTA